jgi:hypothetical protein
MENVKYYFRSACVALICCSLSACNPFKSQTFEDCLLENLKGVKSDNAAADIKYACLVKTSSNENTSEDKKCQNRALTTDENKLINSTAFIERWGTLKVNVYNGNSNIKINAGKVKLIDIEAKQEFSFDLSMYKVAPLTTSEEMLATLLYVPKKWSWYLYDLTTEVCK